MASPIYYARHKQGLTQEDIANKLGVTRQAVARWESGNTTPSAENLKKLSEILKVSRSYLAGEEVLTIDEEGNLVTVPQSDVDDLIMIPMLDVYGACGFDGSDLEHFSEDDVTTSGVQLLGLRPAYARALPGVVSTSKLFLIKCLGDSMEPTISKDGLVLLDMSQTRITSDSIYCLISSGNIFIKRIQRNLDGTMLALSDNPRYKPLTITKEALDSLKILGRVVLHIGFSEI